jgi:hypothetical protein
VLDLVNPIRPGRWSRGGGGKAGFDEAETAAGTHTQHAPFDRNCRPALREFFIVKLIEPLVMHVRDPVKDRLVAAIRKVMVVLLLLLRRGGLPPVGLRPPSVSPPPAHSHPD